MVLTVIYFNLGLDVDWEYPNSLQEGSFYVTMMKDLRKALDFAGLRDGKHYILTSAIPASQYLLNNFLLEQSRKYVDWFNLMAYDASVGTSAAVNQSPLYKNPNDPTGSSSSEVINYMRAKGVNRNQIVLGIPLYAHQYNVAPNDPKNGLFSPKTSSTDSWITNKDIVSLLNTGKYKQFYDGTSQVPYLYNSQDGLFVTYDNVQSVTAKVKYTNYKKLRGIFFWEINQDFLTDQLEVAVLPHAQETISGLTYWPATKLCSPTSIYCNIKC
eukprot:NODE_204_length_12954_cov_1.347880.p5 type:complete len:270 gc:universal NODE_204_length_12954_cov_1.347880:12041-12850(+)